jgi:hypothetical protein
MQLSCLLLWVLQRHRQHMPGLCRQQHTAAADQQQLSQHFDKSPALRVVENVVLACRLSVEDTFRQLCRRTAADIGLACCAVSRAMALRSEIAS